MPAGRQIEAHDPVVRLQKRHVHGHVRGRAAVRLDVDAPLFLGKPERGERAVLAKRLRVVKQRGGRLSIKESVSLESASVGVLRNVYEQTVTRNHTYLDLVDVFVAPVVPSARQTLAVLVG